MLQFIHHVGFNLSETYIFGTRSAGLMDDAYLMSLDILAASLSLDFELTKAWRTFFR